MLLNKCAILIMRKWSRIASELQRRRRSMKREKSKNMGIWPTKIIRMTCDECCNVDFGKSLLVKEAGITLQNCLSANIILCKFGKSVIAVMENAGLSFQTNETLE
mmetsp:Transcript_3054/g.4588  ORF Transcript_3054/g.4588 Transcript_3054/m.4588 type:complete len:105 (-) Transcript_3054:158-472(-)